MISLVTLMLLAGPQAASPKSPVNPTQAKRSQIVTRDAREDINLRTRRKVRLSRDIWEGTITLRTKSASRIAERLLKRPSKLCPTFDANASMLILHCDTRRVRAKIIRRRGRTLLRLERYRGIPSRGMGTLPRISYEAAPKWLGLGAPCPGKRSIIIAECKFKAGKRVTAARLYKKELKGEHHALAALRLGDIARTTGDLPLALGWYRQAGRTGPFARVAMARRCALQGSCFDGARDARAFMPLTIDGLNYPIRDEVVLIGALVRLFDDRPRDAAKYILDLGMTSKTSNPCRLAPKVCSKIARETLRQSQTDPDPVALAFYYALPKRTGAKDAKELAELAADAAHALGATRASAHLLAAVTKRVKKADLADHLDKTARRYIAGDDHARARAVLSYADEVDPNGKDSRSSLRRKVRRKRVHDSVPYAPATVVPEVVAAHGVMFAIKSALETDGAKDVPETSKDAKAGKPQKAAPDGAATAKETLRAAALTTPDPSAAANTREDTE